MAVYTQVTEEQLRDFLADYDLGVYRGHEGIAQGVTNSNFHLFTDRGRFILTLFERRRVNYEDLPFFYDYSGHLRNKGITCPRALPDRSGQAVKELAGRAAVILDFLEGGDVKPADLTPDHCAQVGEMLARMHQAAADFTERRENTMGVGHWEKLVAKAKGYADKFEAGLYQELCAELAYLQAHWPEDLPAGVVHADMFPDNVFFHDGRLSAVIDFYFSCTDYYAFDLAVTVNAWCFEPGDVFSPERFKAMVAAYQTVRPLTAAEKAALPVLHRGSAFRTLISRLEEFYEHKGDTFMTPHDPGEYLRRLRFHQECNVGAYI